MSEKETQRDRILNEARRRVERAEADVRNKGAALRAAEAVLEAHLDSYASLEAALAPKSRKASTKKPTATQGAKEPTADKKSDVPCVAMVPTLDIPCGEREDALIHDPKGGYASYHEFDPGKPARKKREKKEQPAVIPIEGQGVDLAVEMES